MPVNFASIEVSAQTKTDDGEDLEASFDITVGNPDEFPKIDDLKKQCTQLVEKLLEEVQAPKLEEAYTGPVLFEDLSVVRSFYFNFFRGEYSMVTQRKPFSANGISYGGNGLEELINKRITAREISIEDLTGTPEYKGFKLLGHTPIDAQAVVTPPSLLLVENGILKTLLNDRVPTPKVPHSNGHAMFLSGSGANAGVIKMSDTRTKSREELRKELFRIAQEEGYDYAYIVRDVANGGSLPLELYRVNIADGTEKRIRSARINDMGVQAFKKIAAVSDKEFIYNGMAKNLISIIVPDAILFEELQIQSDRVDNFRKPPLVESEEIE